MKSSITPLPAPSRFRTTKIEADPLMQIPLRTFCRAGPARARTIFVFVFVFVLEVRKSDFENPERKTELKGFFSPGVVGAYNPMAYLP